MAPSDPQDGLEHILTHLLQDFMHHMHQTGLSRPQIQALLHIYLAGECPISEISALTDSSPAAASQLVERLVQQELVRRTENPANRRIKKLHLTDKGMKLINQGLASHHFIGELMAVLKPKQRETVHAAFEYLAQASQQIHSAHKRKDQHHA